MRRVIVKGALKTIRFIEPAPTTTIAVTAKGGKKFQIHKEGMVRCVELTTHTGDVLTGGNLFIDGASRLIASDDGVRIETYALVEITTTEECFSVFIVSSGTDHSRSQQVVAENEAVARSMHPIEGFRWDRRSKKWKFAGDARKPCDFKWQSPDDVRCIRIGTDEYAECEERIFLWEE